MLCATVSIRSAVCCIKCANSRSFLQPHIIGMRRKWQRPKAVSANILGGGEADTKAVQLPYTFQSATCALLIFIITNVNIGHFTNITVFYTFICHESNEFLHADSGLFLHLAVQICFLVSTSEFHR